MSTKRRSRAKKRGPGRPDGLTPEAEKRILDGIRAALPLCQAAALAEVDERTLRAWREKGRKEPRSKFGDFVRKLRRARDAGRARLGLTVYQHAVGRSVSVDDKGNVLPGIPADPLLALKVLERRDGAHWNLKRRLDVTQRADPEQADEVADQLMEKLTRLAEQVEPRQEVADGE